MKNRIKRFLLWTTVLALLLTGMSAALADTQSATFVLQVRPRPTETPAATEAPAVTEAPAATETPKATETPAATEAPKATEAPVVTEAPKPTEAPDAPVATEVPATEPVATVEPTVTPEPLRMVMPLLGADEDVLLMYAEASDAAAVVAEVPGSEMIGVKAIGDIWTLAVYGNQEGYVLTDKIALYNEEVKPEEVIRSIIVTSNAIGDAVFYTGDTVTLTATLTGFENLAYTLQWQYTPDGGTTIIDAPDGNGLSYSFTVNDENVGYLWRIQIRLLPEEISEPTDMTAGEA